MEESNEHKESPESYSTNNSLPFSIVGIGASAGGIEALKDFFTHMPPDNSTAFVVILHLDANYKSNLAELFVKFALMPVTQATDMMTIVVNHIYIIPPNAYLTIENNILRVKTPVKPHGASIDKFLISLAKDQGNNAIGIILSGTGSDGMLGLKAIKEGGGMTMAQSADSAKYYSMPSSAIALGVVDFVLSAPEMPAKLTDYCQHAANTRKSSSIDLYKETLAQLDKICLILRQQTRHDFSHYKQGTLIRRIQRRIQILGITSTLNYVEYLRLEQKEVIALLQDLLISVTQFFREPEAFEALATEVLPNLLQKKGENIIRIWVIGCATGEEAYSIGILLREQCHKLNRFPRIQIFATDIDNQALEVARQGKYPETIATHISSERLERFFVKIGDKYQIVTEIRELCIFSAHDIIRDPPFSRIDMVSCRNVLIYLQPDLQNKLIPLFHYALRSGGYLFLGSTENVISQVDLFRTINKKHRFYQRKDTIASPAFTFPFGGGSEFIKHQSQIPELMPITKGESLSKIIEQVILVNYAPSCVIVNDRGDAVYFFGRTGKYLEPAAGVPNNSIIDMARKGLRTELRAALRKAITTQTSVILKNVMIETNDELQAINLIIRPLPELGEPVNFWLIVFQDVGHLQHKDAIHAGTILSKADETLIQHLENELNATKEHLQLTVEELEVANEKLKSSNEELLSMNEELQSSNEEMQTSKEELQSINEELQTINSELTKKVEELDAANSDLHNLLDRTPIATIFLDNSLRIRNFTPAITNIFRLIESDIGRPLTDIASSIINGDMIKEIKEVLRTLSTKEQEIKMEDHSCYIMRIFPYRTVHNVIDGVVMVFINITEIRKANDLVAESETRFRQLTNAMPEMAWIARADGYCEYFNQQWLKYTGLTLSQSIGNSWQTVISPDELEVFLTTYRETIKKGQVLETQCRLKQADGIFHSYLIKMLPIMDKTGEITRWFGICTNIDTLIQAEQSLKEAFHSQDEFIIKRDNELEKLVLPLKDCLSILKQPSADSAQREKAIMTMEKQVDYLSTLLS